jgi:hypothetical protein
MDILYYSNYCKHSQNIIQQLAKNDLREKISFICIDKRARDPKNNQIYVVLENGTKVVMPPNIHSVPALLLVRQKYRVLYGDEIMGYFEPYIQEKQEAANQNQGEPLAFSIASCSMSSNITSEQYTLYSMTPEELSSKGSGGRRQLHNYVSANQDVLMIQTPPDNYRPDKLSQSVTVDSLQQQRNSEVPQREMPAVGI